MRKRAISTLVAGCLLGGTAVANDGSIGVFFDAGCATCSQTATLGTPFTMYVNATSAGRTSHGILGAQFRIDGMPADWFRYITPNPHVSLMRGDPFGGFGCVTAFDSCVVSSQGCLNLFTVFVLPTSARENVRLEVHKDVSIWEPPWDLPLVYLCGPVLWSVNVNAGTAILNGPPCTVSATPTAWSRVKALYRN